MPRTVPDPPSHSSCFQEEGFLFFSRNVFGYYEVGSGIISGSIQALPRFCQAHQSICLTSALIARPVTEIVPEIMPEPCVVPGRRISMFFSRNVFGHYEGVDRALFTAFRVLFGLYQGSTRPTKVSASPVPS